MTMPCFGVLVVRCMFDYLSRWCLDCITLKKRKHELFETLAWHQSGDIPLKLAHVFIFTMNNTFLLILFRHINKQYILIKCGQETFFCIPNALFIPMSTYRPLPGPQSFFQYQNKLRNLCFVFCAQIRATKSYCRICTRVHIVYLVAL